jgi:peptide/nickel transport system permease protein
MTAITALPNQAAPGFWKRALGHRSFVIGAVLTLLLLAGMAGLSLVWTPWLALRR